MKYGSLDRRYLNMVEFVFSRTSSSSTAVKEARIQTGAFPAVGWSVLLADWFSCWAANHLNQESTVSR